MNKNVFLLITAILCLVSNITYGKIGLSFNISNPISNVAKISTFENQSGSLTNESDLSLNKEFGFNLINQVTFKNICSIHTGLGYFSSSYSYLNTNSYNLDLKMLRGTIEFIYHLSNYGSGDFQGYSGPSISIFYNKISSFNSTENINFSISQNQPAYSLGYYFGELRTTIGIQQQKFSLTGNYELNNQNLKIDFKYTTWFANYAMVF